MSQDKELEIQLQFLDEAQEYLDTIEAALLEIASSGVDSQKVNAALRAAHSVKGGAAMMGFHTLSQLAHRLEDSFKVLKVQRNAIAIDGDLERSLLAGADCLRQVIEQHRHFHTPDPGWLNHAVQPIFDYLHQRLGDPVAEDANSLLSPEEGQDILPLLFETEVEGCLQRLESVLTSGSPCLREEVEILAQELGGLGEMLQLTAFTHLCESITQALNAAPDRTIEIADAALQAWRRSQALVLTGNLAAMPSAIEIAGVFENTQTTRTIPVAEFDDFIEPEVAEAFEITDLLDGVVEEITEEQVTEEEFIETGFVEEEFVETGFIETEAVFTDFEAIAATENITNFEMISDSEIISNSEMISNSEIFSETQQFADTNVIPEWKHIIDSEPVPHTELDNELDAELDPELDPALDAELDVELDSELDNNLHFNQSITDVDSIVDSITDAEFVSAPSFAEVAAEVASEVASDLTLDTQVIQTTPSPTTSVQPSIQPPHPRSATEFRILNDPTEAPPIEEVQDNTVRVPVKHLNQMNDLLGELTIERNRLDLHLKRMRSLLQTLSHRVQVLDQSNAQLRVAYDRVETQSNAFPSLQPADSSSLLIYREDPGSAEATDHRFDVLEMDRYNEQHLLSQEVMETIVQIQEVTSDIELGLDDTEQTNRDLHKTAKQLQTSLGHVRMRPLSDIVDRFPKAIRELSLKYNKPVQLKVYGGNTLVDRNILEALNDPLLHLIRNAFDHGIEAPETRRLRGKTELGTIEIRAFHRGNRTIITINDDGGGIPLEKIRHRARQMGLDEVLLAAASDEELLSLIFEPGFTTRDQVTDLSGRGIGMDVVRNNLKQIRGDINVSTQAGLGTTFTLSVPFTLTVARVLLAESGGMLMAFPTDVIDEVFVLQRHQVVMAAGNEAIRWQDTIVQLIHLARWLRFNCPRQMDGLETPPTINEPAVLILNPGTQSVGLQVDRCWGEQEVALRKVEGNLPLPAGFNSCTILGDGRVVPLVNVPELLHWIASCDRAEFVPTPPIALSPASPDPRLPSASPSPLAPSSFSLPALPTSTLQPARKPTVLVVDDSINVRRLLVLTLEKAGYQVAQAKDGQDALDKLAAGLQVQAVICDIEMPRLDGYGFLARVKAIPDLQQLPIAMLTSRSGDKHRQLAMNLGATAYFSKPYNEQALLQTLEKLVGLVGAH